ncbi:MAG: hypothetical protein O3A51_13720 [Verrucomicrobia bacterium]|nr:hypothetical protein [Verrucomicrobiota bacterium]
MFIRAIAKQPVATPLARVVRVVLAMAVTLAVARADSPKMTTLGPTRVEATGFATMTNALDLADAHRRALVDAYRNATMQAHMAMDVEARVANLRLSERGMRSRGMGYVQSTDILEAGIVPESGDQLYRIHLSALIHPLTTFPIDRPGDPTCEARWIPSVRLQLSTTLPADEEQIIRAALSRSLSLCGVAVEPPDSQTPSLNTTITVTRGTDANHVVTNWRMALDRDEPRHRDWAAQPVVGEWMLVMEPGDPVDWWQRLGTRLAQDAIRLWSTPRRVTLTFQDVSARQVIMLTEAFGVESDRKQYTESGRTMLDVEWPAAGNPACDIAAILSKAGLAKIAEPVETSLTHLVFRFSGP